MERTFALNTASPQAFSKKLPNFVIELVNLRPSVIFALGTTSTLAAKAATSVIPVVFGTGVDPVNLGVVSSLQRPGSNLTGVSTFNAQLSAKQLGLLRDLLSKPLVIGVLVAEGAPSAEPQVLALKAAAETLGQELLFFNARTAQEIDTAFDSLVARRADALMVTVNAIFSTHREQICALALRHQLPAIYTQREYVKLGGLISYDTNIWEMYRHAGVYVGRILKGEKPSDLPIMQPTKFELLINLKTAKALGLEIPPGILAIADEVIE
jgi:putative ABC transport system substrate-binding protein